MFDRTISELYGLTKGPKGFHVGIEVEMEFDPRQQVPAMPADDSVWSFHADGSLLNGLEAVTRPIFPDSKHWIVGAAQLDDFFRRSPLVRDSERTSTHVHLNVSDRSLRDTFTIGTAFWAMENILFSFCADHRRSNHFCIGVSDTIVTIEEVTRQVKQGNLPTISEERGKYSSLNWARLRNIGTLECRIREGLTDAQEVFGWARLVSNLGANAIANWRNSSDLIKELSEAPEATALKLLGERHFRQAKDLHGEKLAFVAASNVLPLVPLMSIDWSKDYSASTSKKKKAISIPVPPVEDDPIFVGDEIVEFDEALFVPDEQPEEAPAAPHPADFRDVALGQMVERLARDNPDFIRPDAQIREWDADAGRLRVRAPRPQGVAANLIWPDDPFNPR